jgi:hypothetical protein
MRVECMIIRRHLVFLSLSEDSIVEVNNLGVA